MDAEQTERAVRVAYDEVADSYADHFGSTEPEQPVDLAMIQHFAGRLEGDRRVLDAGCGAGRMLPVLARWVGHVDGVDLSPRMVRRARRDHPEFRTCVASLTALPYADQTFDGVVSWYSTVHCPDAGLPTVLAELRRVLREGGLAVLGFQSGDAVRDVSPTYRSFGHDVTLVRYERSVDHVAGALAGVGLREVARLEREPVDAYEGGSQAVLIARRWR